MVWAKLTTWQHWIYLNLAANWSNKVGVLYEYTAYLSGCDTSEADEADLALLHVAIAASRPVRMRYTNLDDNQTERKVLPLALVHPPQGVKLLAWCENRGDFRQFFVRSVQRLELLSGDFSDQRLPYCRGFWSKNQRASDGFG